MKLLVVTDLEDSSEAFLAEARKWAARFAKGVWLVHVEDPDLLALLRTLPVDDLFITSGVVLTGDPSPAEAFRLP